MLLIAVVLRSAVLYFFLIFIIRLMGKRQLGEMEPSEFVVSLLIADLAAAPMQETGMPVLSAVLPIMIVFVLELLLSVLAFHSIFFRKLFCGKPIILMENGKILPNNLRRTRVTPDELTELLREKGVIDLNTVKYAILETNGQISTLLDPNHEPPSAVELGVSVSPVSLPYTIICNGKILRDNLSLSGKNTDWLANIMRKNHCTVSQVLLLTVDSYDNVYIAKQ